MKPSEIIQRHAKENALLVASPEMLLIMSIMKYLDTQHDKNN